MSPVSALAILATVLVTAFISGIFGMAGGLILMGVLAALLPVATAMVVHGVVQMVSNGYRALLWRKYISWPVFGRYALGSLAAFGLLSPVVAGAAMALSSVSVVSNALLLGRFRPTPTPDRP
jgi:uncharacterized membrane protein YfcA